jgi:hypothetical protein
VNVAVVATNLLNAWGRVAQLSRPRNPRYASRK